MLLKNSFLSAIALRRGIRNVCLRFAIAHKACNRDIFPAESQRTRQAEFFNSIGPLRNATSWFRIAIGSAPGRLAPTFYVKCTSVNFSSSMADFYSVKDDAAKLVIQLGTEIDLFFVLASLLLLLDAYLYRGSNTHYSLLTFDWSSQHGLNIGAIVGFFVAFSFVMTFVTPLLLLLVEFMMVLPWWFTMLFLVMSLWVAFEVGIPFLGAILVVLATAPAWREIAWFFKDKEKDREKWRPPNGHVSASQLREFAYKNENKNEKVFLLDRLDKHDAAKPAGENKRLPRLAAGFVVTSVINAVVGYSDRGTIIWHLFKWSSGLSENLQRLVQIAGVIFGFLLLAFLAELFRSHLQPDWIYYPPLAEENERKRQERL